MFAPAATVEIADVENDTMRPIWRLCYYGCGAVVALLSLLTGLPVTADNLFLTLSLLILVVWCFVAFLVWLVTVRPRDPLRQIVLRAPSASLSYLDRGLLFLTIPIFWAYFAPVKSMIPEATNFWADPYLAAADRFFFLGTDPSTLTHYFLGELATKVIDVVYASWLPVILIVALVVAMVGDERSCGRFYLGWGLIWLLLGVAGAYAFGSAGPIFSGHLGGGFEPLLNRLQNVHEHRTLVAILARDALWTNYQNGNVTIGNGISAAPSLHCAIAFFLALLARGTRLFVLALPYAVLIWIGSIHLGWHYFIDGLISLLGVLILWPIINTVVNQQIGKASV